jgi:hypothetical protein
LKVAAGETPDNSVEAPRVEAKEFEKGLEVSESVVIGGHPASGAGKTTKASLAFGLTAGFGTGGIIT